MGGGNFDLDGPAIPWAITDGALMIWRDEEAIVRDMRRGVKLIMGIIDLCG